MRRPFARLAQGVRAPLEKSGVAFTPLGREQYRQFLAAETQRWKDYTARAGIEPQ